jgi:uncharacterized protein with FMN-binding domain
VTPIKNNLVALGSAAVVAVYSAGYIRTREAAERFAVEDSQRRQDYERHAQPVPVAPVPVAAEPARDTSTHAAPHAREAVTPKHTPAKTAPRPHDAAPKAADTASASHVDVASRPEPKPAESTPPVSAPTPAPVAPTPEMTFKVTPPASADTTADADKPLKDGVYSGYGRSRHGDIEATVSIKNGKIAEAFISQCLTQYSCSWIAALPPQVVARQSAEVDYVSGATQSTNAFYYAVVAALKKAK